MGENKLGLVFKCFKSGRKARKRMKRNTKRKSKNKK